MVVISVVEEGKLDNAGDGWMRTLDLGSEDVSMGGTALNQPALQTKPGRAQPAPRAQALQAQPHAGLEIK